MIRLEKYVRVILILGFVCSGDFVSADTPQKVRETLRSAVFGFAPWGMMADGRPINTAKLHQEERYSGVMPDMIRMLSHEIGEPIEIVPVSYSRMFALLGSGEVDFAFFFQSADSKVITDSLVKTHEMRTVIIVPKSYKSTIVEELIFASPRSVLYDPSFDSNEQIERIYTNDYTHAVRLLSKQRVTALIGPEIFLLYSFDQTSEDPRKYKILSEINVNNVYLQYSKKSPLREKAQYLEKAAQKFADDGSFRSLVSSYFRVPNLSFPEEGK